MNHRRPVRTFDVAPEATAYAPLAAASQIYQPDQTVVLIDAQAAAYRAFYTRDLSADDGTNTSVLHGLLEFARAVCENARTTRALFVWDGSVDYKRRLHSGYKIRHDRALTSEEIVARENFRNARQIAERVLGDLGVPQFRAPQIECDDAIGLLCTAVPHASATNAIPPVRRVLIASDDKDFYQLLRDADPSSGCAVHVWRPTQQQYQTAASFSGKFGFDPPRFVDYKALVGESAAGDNIPGVAGWGDVTAAKYVAVHGDLEAIIAAANAVAHKTPGKLRAVERSLLASIDAARLSRTLSRITRTRADLAAVLRPADVDAVARAVISVARCPHLGSPTGRRCAVAFAMRMRSVYSFGDALDMPRLAAALGLTFTDGLGKPTPWVGWATR